MDVPLSDFVRYAAETGRSDKAVGVGADARVTDRGVFSRHDNIQAWRDFSAALNRSYGISVPGTVIHSGKPLTACHIIDRCKNARSQYQSRFAETFRSTVESAPLPTALAAIPKGALYDLYVRNRIYEGADDQTRLAMLSQALAAENGAPSTYASDHHPVGLAEFGGVAFTRNETSVEDLVRTGRLRPGDPMAGGRFVYQGLKTKGVEPGFLIQPPWPSSYDEELMGRTVPVSDKFSLAVDAVLRLFTSWKDYGDSQQDADCCGRLVADVCCFMKDYTLLERLAKNQVTPRDAALLIPPEILRHYAAEQLNPDGRPFRRLAVNEARHHVRQVLPALASQIV
ncbi:MAG: hypothetical protein LIP77_01145, partial [Planctomycetes bacterium]|nr:hypothetical protein [Planctomycetota bacterium]